MARQFTGKQLLFIDCYMASSDFNGTQAAEDAGYDGSREVLAAIAYENLRKPHIKAEIERRLSAYMTSDEVLYRLTEIARADLGDTLDDNGDIDLKKAKQLKKTKFLKRVKRKETTTQHGGSDETEVEQYSRIEALELLGKKHKLFVERMEVGDPNGGPLRIIIEETSGSSSK
jgi:phage terminase small subunit